MRPPAPMTPTRSASLAPRIRVEARAVSPLAIIKLRRVGGFCMRHILAARSQRGKRLARAHLCRYISGTLFSPFLWALLLPFLQLVKIQGQPALPLAPRSLLYARKTQTRSSQTRRVDDACAESRQSLFSPRTL